MVAAINFDYNTNSYQNDEWLSSQFIRVQSPYIFNSSHQVVDTNNKSGTSSSHDSAHDSIITKLSLVACTKAYSVLICGLHEEPVRATIDVMGGM